MIPAYWEDFLEEVHDTQLESQLYHARYPRLYKRLKDKTPMDYEEFKEWAAWARAHLGLSKAGQKPTSEALPPSQATSQWAHSHGYYFDESRDVYVVHLPSKRKPFAIPGSTWRSLREAYSNWDGAPDSVNSIARKFGMARQTVTELLRAMGTTHDSAPWSDEDLQARQEQELIEDLLRSKEERVLRTAEQKEWRKIKADAEAFRRIDLMAKRIRERLDGEVPLYIPRVREPAYEEHPSALVISPTDFHFGMLAEGYNRQIARSRLLNTANDLLHRSTKAGHPERVVLALGGDGLHMDNFQGTTTKGTPQECDGSPEDIAWTYILLCRDLIDLCAEYSFVEVLVIPGNHDRYSSVLIRAALLGWFNHREDVTVSAVHDQRQYSKFGSSMLGFFHGDTGKVNDWPAQMAAERPKMWGGTEHRYIFTGHLHTERELPTFGNVTVYRMPSLSGRCNWTKRKGYQSRAALIAYKVDAVRGVIATYIEPVEESNDTED